MPLNEKALTEWRAEGIRQSFQPDDTILYALGVGVGLDPIDDRELRFVYEEALEALPTLATVLCFPWGWLRKANAGVTMASVVHAEQSTRFRTLPAHGELVADARVARIVDKGAEKGALVSLERNVFDSRNGDHLLTDRSTVFCRADGGFRNAAERSIARQILPQRPPDVTADLPTSRQSALIYRLCGDRNPLHVDPAAGREAGFGQPILHGLATYGVACHALLRTLCGYDTSILSALGGRFAAPVFPGDRLRIEIWREGCEAKFRIRVPERDVTVLDNGMASLSR